MRDLCAAVCLALVLEGLFLFAAPGAYRRMVEQVLALPPSRLRAIGAVTMAMGALALWLVRQA